MNSRAFQIFIALSIPIIVIISVLVLISLEKKSTNTVDSNFPYELYSSSPKSCIGNTYFAVIEIDSQLAIVEEEEDSGKVVLATTDNGKPLPIYIPDSLGSNVHPKQKFRATLRVSKNGGLKAVELNKF